MKLSNHTRGLWAETAAVWFLRAKGYRVLRQRYKTPFGEVDIIAKRGSTLVFVEVKWRKRADDSATAISAQSLLRIQRAAQSFLQKAPQYSHCNIRFDGILFSAYPVSKWIVHLKNVSML